MDVGREEEKLGGFGSEPAVAFVQPALTEEQGLFPYAQGVDDDRSFFQGERVDGLHNDAARSYKLRVKR